MISDHSLTLQTNQSLKCPAYILRFFLAAVTPEFFYHLLTSLKQTQWLFLHLPINEWYIPFHISQEICNKNQDCYYQKCEWHPSLHNHQNHGVPEFFQVYFSKIDTIPEAVSYHLFWHCQSKHRSVFWKPHQNESLKILVWYYFH